MMLTTQRRCAVLACMAGLAVTLAIGTAAAADRAVDPPAKPALGSAARPGMQPRLMVQVGHDNALAVRMSVSPTGRLAATADESSLRIWNVDIGRLVCAINIRSRHPAAHRSPPGGQAQAEDEKDGADTPSLAWSADGQSLYMPTGPRTLRRYDLPRCVVAEQVGVVWPAARARDGAAAESNPDDDEIEQLSTLKDGRILMLSTYGLHALTVSGSQATATPLAMLKQDPVELPKPRIEDLFSKDGQARLMQQLLGALGDLTIAGHSADGRVVLLTAQAVQLGPIAMPMSAAEPRLFVDGKSLAWPALKGGAASYKGVSAGAVSASGRWLALRSAAPGGATVSVFDLRARQLVSRVTLKGQGGPKASLGRDVPFFDQHQALIGAVGGLAFSADEEQLVLLRPRVDAPEGAVDDPALELRRISDLGLVGRLALRGTVVAQDDLLAGTTTAGGNAMMVSADQTSMAFQNVSLVRGSTMAALKWKNSSPHLASWAASEGAMFGLAFADDKTLVSLQSLQQGPPSVALAATGGLSAKVDPAQALRSLEHAAQSQLWSLDSGEARRLWAGRILVKSDKLLQIDPQQGRLLRADVQIVQPGKVTMSVVMQATDGAGTEMWRLPLFGADGLPQRVQALAWSADRRWVAVLAAAEGAFTASNPTSSFSGIVAGSAVLSDTAAAGSAAPAAPPQPARRPDNTAMAAQGNAARAAALLDKLLGGDLAERVRQAGTEAAPTSAAAPDAGLQVGAIKASRTRSGPAHQLLLVDAVDGQVLSRLDLADKAVDDEDGLHFINGQRLLVGQHVVDQRRDGPAWRLVASSIRPLSAKPLGVTPETGRPIVAGAMPDASLRALVLPAAQVGARLAVSSRSDRWVAVSQRGAVSVHDADQSMRSVFVAALQGTEASAMALTPNGLHLAVGTTLGTIQMFDLRRSTPVATLVGLSNAGWAVVDAEGRFDTSSLGNNPALHWVMPDEPLQALPFEVAMRTHYTPRLLPQLLDDSARLMPVPPLALVNRVAPRVTIDAIEPVSGQPGSARVQVSVVSQTNEKGQASGAIDLRLFRNGQLVGYAPANDGALPLDASGRFSRVFDNVLLPEGAGVPLEFQAYAFNSDGLRSAVAERRWQPPVPTPPRPRRAFVLAVGSNTYDNAAWPQLAYAVNDARLVNEAMVASLKGTQEFSEVVGVTLESDARGRSDASKSRIAAAIGRLAGRPDLAQLLAGVPGADRLAQATPADLVLISFAGHGYVSNRSGELHLVPSDITASAEGQADGIARFDARSISAAELERWLRDVDAGQMALVVDACRSAAAVDDGFKAGPMGSRGLGQLAYDKGARILTATQAADDAMEFASLRHGLLTFALIEEGLRAGQADLRPRDRRIDLVEWLSFAALRVPELHAAVQQRKPVNVAGRSWTTSRAATRLPAPVASVPAQRLQKPSLFDYTPQGRPVPVVGVLP